MKIKYHIHLQGPQLGGLKIILDMIAANNSETKIYTIDDLYCVCKSEKLLYPSMYKDVDYFLDDVSQELVCHKFNDTDEESIFWTVIACDVYELKDDDITNFSNN